MENYSKSIFAIMLESPDLSHFAHLLKAHNLSDGLTGKGPFTVFAPTNDVLALKEAKIVRQGPHAVAAFLKHHIVLGVFESKTFPKKLQTLASDTLDTKNLSIIEPDIHAKNGIIHKVRYYYDE